MQRENKGLRTFLIILSIVLGLVLAALVCATGYAVHLNNLVQREDGTVETLSQE